MPKCDACGKNYDDAKLLELVRNRDNRWVSVCKPCLALGIDINQVERGNPVDEQALSAADAPFIAVARTGDPMADAKNLLEALRSLRQSAERVGRARSHERKQVELTVHFTLARDDTRHEGTVKDFSQGGMRVVTRFPLTKGQVVQFDWNVPLPPAMARMLQSAGEVRRVVKNEEGLFDAGFKFLTRRPDKGANRRRFRRYKCDMATYYHREGSELMSHGTVTDISQGGCQMMLDENMEQGEVFTARLVGGGGVRGDLAGSMQVRRSIPRESMFEIGCLFEKMRMEKQADADSGADEAAAPGVP